MTVLLLTVAGLVIAALLGYLAAWAAIGHEPLLARHCHCSGRR